MPSPRDSAATTTFCANSATSMVAIMKCSVMPSLNSRSCSAQQLAERFRSAQNTRNSAAVPIYF